VSQSPTLLESNWSKISVLPGTVTRMLKDSLVMLQTEFSNLERRLPEEVGKFGGFFSGLFLQESD